MMCQKKALKSFPGDLGNSTFASWKYDIPKIRKADLFPLIWGFSIYNPGQSHRLREEEWYLLIYFFLIGTIKDQMI